MQLNSIFVGHTNIMKSFLFFFVFLASLNVSGQFWNPYRMTSDGSSFFVTNRGTGAVSKLDSTFAHSLIITGLHSPNDIFYGSFAGNSALMVIDSNYAKLYDPSTYAPYFNITIPAVEAHDGVFNPSNPNVFYIGDRGGNKILRGTVGSAPFYPITFDTLVSGISRPAGMILNNQGKLIVVSNTTNSKVYEVNISTGAKSVVLSTNLDDFNDIAQDNEGNYYITCWGDDNLYRYDSTFGNQYKVTTFNNPSGLYANLDDDFLGICCYNCQKVEFKYFHLFSPLTDIFSCTTDSFYADFTPTYKGIGTYNSNNRFVVELSDSNGLFDNVIEIGSDSTAIRPGSIKCAVPDNDYALSGYKYRLRSTSPEVNGYFLKDLTIYPTPKAKLSAINPEVICLGTSLQLGDSSKLNYQYSWSPKLMLDDSTKSDPIFSTTISGDYNLSLDLLDTITGCSSTDSLLIKVNPQLELIKNSDTVAMCLGDSITVGVTNHPFIYNWQGSDSITSVTESNPTFFGNISTLLRVHFTDSNNTCSGDDSIYVLVNPLPNVSFTTQELVVCENDSMVLQDYSDTIYTFKHNTAWDFPLLEFSIGRKVYLADSVGVFNYEVLVTNASTGCNKSYDFTARVLNVPDSFVLYYIEADKYFNAELFGSSKNGTVKWYINNNFVASGEDTLHLSRLQNLDTLYAEWVGFDECGILSNTLVWKKSTGIVNLEEVSFNIYPNPANHYVAISSRETIYESKIWSYDGRIISSSKINANNFKLDVSSLPKGIYFVSVRTSLGYSIEKLVIN
jgi:hypothetical protein